MLNEPDFEYYEITATQPNTTNLLNSLGIPFSTQRVKVKNIKRQTKTDRRVVPTPGVKIQNDYWQRRFNFLSRQQYTVIQIKHRLALPPRGDNYKSEKYLDAHTHKPSSISDLVFPTVDEARKEMV
jgi:hypothetical protein